jgi:RHS repeat-associated protein
VEGLAGGLTPSRRGVFIGQCQHGTFYYLGTDVLGSTELTLSASGAEQGSFLYQPYGAARYSSGSLQTLRRFTGQVRDATLGLTYYGARYYDVGAGQFVSADSILPGGGYDALGLSRYAYVEGNPETATDSTGHDQWWNDPTFQQGPPNNDNWTDYGPDIAIHRNDRYIRSPWFDDRWHIDPGAANNANLRRAYAQEKSDGPALAKYFGLTVEWQNDANSTGYPGDTADYLIGLDARVDQDAPGWLRFIRTIIGSPPVYASDFQTVEYGTPADLYYPQATTSPNRVRNVVMSKHGQAPVVVVDVSDDPQMANMSSDQIQGWANNVIKPGANPTVNRVIVMKNGQVWYDTYSVVPWGPPPAGGSGGGF